MSPASTVPPSPSTPAPAGRRTPRTPPHRAKAISLIGVAGLAALERHGLVVVPASRVLALRELLRMLPEELQATAFAPQASASPEEEAEVAS